MQHFRFVVPKRTRFFAAVCAISTIATSIPFSAVAAEDQGSVTRGEFIRTTIKTLQIPLDDDMDAPTERLPKALLPSIGVARKRGALAIFGDAIDHSKAISRGEAAFVLMKLTQKSAKTITIKYSDVPRASNVAEAVQVAVHEQWMKPVRPALFGVDRALTVREFKLIQVRLKKPVPPPKQEKGITDLPTIRVNIKKPTDLPKGDILDAIWQILNNQYLYKEKINGEEASYKAAEGLVQSLNDPYTVFMRPASSKQFRTQIGGEVSGIGAQVEQKNGALIIVSPLKGSPAEKAGLLPGDEIIAADGKPLQGMSFEDAVNKVRGPKGTSVKLTIRRNGAEFDVSVMRDTVKVPEIEISFQGDIAVVKIHQFGQITERDLRSLMVNVQKENPKGVVLDLRSNPGGLLHAADIVVSNFLPEGSVVASITSNERTYKEMTSNAPTIDASVPIVVLVNKGSASASEIVAGALQDAGRAKIVGEKTFGKGTVQQVLQFTDGSSLKMTVAEWFTPEGRKIDGVGVQPDYTVEYGDRDEQMLKALELLR